MVLIGIYACKNDFKNRDYFITKIKLNEQILILIVSTGKKYFLSLKFLFCMSNTIIYVIY